jgi:acyl-CoA synthetase (AMP-forming)/AMP-acid ligase II
MNVGAAMLGDAPLPARLPRRIGWLPFEQARRRPDAEALVAGSTAWTYGQFADAIRRTARLLDELGVRPGDRLLIVGENSVALVTLIMAASEIDAWPVPVNARLTAAEIGRIRDHARPRRAFYTTGASPDAARHAAADGATPVPADIVPGAAVGALLEADPEPLERSASRQVGALIYTSGTSGRPKGVMVSHRNLLFNAAVACMIRRLVPEDRMCIVLPITHIFGLASVFLAGVMAGVRIRLESRFDPDTLLTAMAEDGISVVQGVPTMYARLLERVEAAGRAVTAPRLRYLSSGGGPLEPSLKARVERLFAITLQNGYGLTEAAPVVSMTRLDDPNPTCSIGFPPPDVAVRLVDDGGADVAPGSTGELLVKGPNVMLGYYRDPELTAATITPDGWLKTGDLARAEPDGRLAIMGRKKELIIRGGFNVHPEEVEAALNSHPAVFLSGVVGHRNGIDEDVVAFIQPRPGARPDLDDITRHAANLLAPYKRPGRIVVMDPLPATTSGKVMKGKLRDMMEGS